MTPKQQFSGYPGYVWVALAKRARAVGEGPPEVDANLEEQLEARYVEAVTAWRQTQNAPAHSPECERLKKAALDRLVAAQQELYRKVKKPRALQHAHAWLSAQNA